MSLCNKQSFRIMLSVAGFFPEVSGGGQVHVLELANALQRHGHEVSILTTAPWHGMNGQYHIDICQYEYLRIIKICINPEYLTDFEKMTRAPQILSRLIKEILSDETIDLVHAHGLKSEMLSVCSELGVPVIVTAHHPGFVCPNGVLLTPENALCAKRVDLQWCVACCFQQRYKGLFGRVASHFPVWFFKIPEKLLEKSHNVGKIGRALLFPKTVANAIKSARIRVQHPVRIIAPSRAMKELIVRNGGNPERIDVVPHGIQSLMNVESGSYPQDIVRFGFVGRVDRVKGLDILLEASGLLPDASKFEIHVFGDAQNAWDKIYFEDILRKTKESVKVIAHGYVPRAKLARAFESIDVLVLVPIYLEVFGLVVLEAFSAGKPVIVSKSGGPEEIVRDGKDGFVVERNDSASLAEAMRKFIDEPELLKKMSRRVPVVKTMEEYAREIECIYDESMASGYDS